MGGYRAPKKTKANVEKKRLSPETQVPFAVKGSSVVTLVEMPRIPYRSTTIFPRICTDCPLRVQLNRAR